MVDQESCAPFHEFRIQIPHPTTLCDEFCGDASEISISSAGGKIKSSMLSFRDICVGLQLPVLTFIILNKKRSFKKGCNAIC